MGQRLNIEIVKNETVLASSYYHWSGYSNTAINLTEKIIKEFNYTEKYRCNEPCENHDLLFAIRLLEITGAGIDIEDIKEAQKILGNPKISLNECKGRNEGIIEVTNEGIKENRSWEEGRVTINIENKTFNFDVITECSLKELLEDDEISEEEIKDVKIKFQNIPFSGVFELKAFIDKSDFNNEIYFHNQLDNTFFGLTL